MTSGKKTMVISGINLFEGGTLSIYKDFLKALIEKKIPDDYEVTIFVHKKELFADYAQYVTILELPDSRKSYLNRLYYEYVYFWFWSCKRHVDIWVSLHDMTPNVRADRRYVYCHNPSPFLKRTKAICKLGKTYYYMSLFYKYLYQINIKKNTAVIVQQNWLRQEFTKMFGVRNIIVARPDIKVEVPTVVEGKNPDKPVFIYSAYPRPFKNFEVICQASRILEQEGLDFEVQFTIDGTENPYAEMIYQEYFGVRSIHWLGLIGRDEMFRKYGQSDYLIFPSLLETWSLPITEYKEFGKPLICADLPYAHETVGTYDAVSFFAPESPEQLADIMRAVIKGTHRFSSVTAKAVDQPFAQDWQTLIEWITG